MYSCVSEAYTIYPPEECKTPLGFPVDPEVYKIKRGSSAFNSAGLLVSSTLFFSSCHQISLSFKKLILLPVLLTTSTLLILFSFSSALSTLLFKGNIFPPLTDSSAVIKNVDEQSLILS